MPGDIILLYAVHYNYNALHEGLHEICSTTHSFDLRCESVTYIFFFHINPYYYVLSYLMIYTCIYIATYIGNAYYMSKFVKQVLKPPSYVHTYNFTTVKGRNFEFALTLF